MSEGMQAAIGIPLMLMAILIVGPVIFLLTIKWLNFVAKILGL
jgi:hypothetical protein